MNALLLIQSLSYQERNALRQALKSTNPPLATCHEKNLLREGKRITAARAYMDRNPGIQLDRALEALEQ